MLSYRKLVNTLEGCRALDGDIYDKAGFLMKNLIQGHPFASGNRRTAFITAKDFLISNGAKFAIPDHPKQAKVMLGIRETFYTDSR